MALRVVSPPAIEPITVSDAKLHSRVDTSLEDDILELWIESARAFAESYQNRAYITQTLQLTMDAFPPGSVIQLPRPPLQSVTSVTYYDEDDTPDTLDAGDYIVDEVTQPGMIVLRANKSWPDATLRAKNGIVIEYIAGYGDDAADVPSQVRDALLLYVTTRYEHRELAHDDMISMGHFLSLLRPHRVVPVR